MDIEESAENSPDDILRMPMLASRGIKPFQVRTLHHFWCNDRFDISETEKILVGLWNTYWNNDATLVEINPLAITSDKKLLALDAKMSTDDNASFRHREWSDFQETEEVDPAELEAERHNLSYIKLPGGSVGCLVNGAGLAMTTMDIIKLHGGEPANFLDVGGGATTKAVAAAFKILTSDKDVKSILVNIFGGIMRCDVIAQGIVDALKQVQLKVPLVVRLEGTNLKEGRVILEKSSIPLVFANTLTEAAVKSVTLAREVK